MGALVLSCVRTADLQAGNKGEVDGLGVHSGYVALTQSGTFPNHVNAERVYVELIGAGRAGNYVSSVTIDGTGHIPDGGGAMNA